MRDLANFITGFQRFQKKYFGPERTLFDQLKRAQHPKALVVACCDSRVDPAILTDCDPGDLFVVRNVANLVPPYVRGGEHPGTRAALEFAVCVLGVEHLIVLGHSQCGGIGALLAGESAGGQGEFIPQWLSIAQRARAQVLAELPDQTPALQARACERAALLVSLENLLTFPWVRERLERGALALHGWYFDIERGELLGYDPASRRFDPLQSGHRKLP